MTPAESHDWPLLLEFPESPVSPVSEGQCLAKEPETKLKALATRNACAAGDKVGGKRFQLARDVRAFQTMINRELTPDELLLACNEWERLSAPFLGSSKGSHFVKFLAQLAKVKVPTGEGATIENALANVERLSDADLFEIAGFPDGGPIKMRRILALHQELSRMCGGKKYYLSYRDAAKVCDNLSHQEAHEITFALATLGRIRIVSKGKANPNGGKAAEFRYLGSGVEKNAEEHKGGLVL